MGEVARLQRGRVISKQYLVENMGVYPVYSSQTSNNGEIGKIDTFDFDGEYISWTTDGANAGTVFYRIGKFSITNVCGLISILDLSKLDYKFLFYWLSIEAKKYVYSGMGNPKLMSNQMEKILIPIPPLSVQQEIVKILDKMTALTSELTSELTLRKKQYQYYRDKLLTFGDDVEWKTLGEVLHSIKTGLNPRKFFSLNTSDAKYYYVTIKEINGGKLRFLSSTDKINERAKKLCNARSHIEEHDILFSGTGTIGEIYVIDHNPYNWDIKEGVYALKPKKDIVISKYIKYILSHSDIKEKYSQLIVGGTVKSIPMKVLYGLKIPIPPLSVQQKIVDILDKFDTLTQSISEGLPKEIALRTKQYEYYREQLLSFI